MEFTPGDRVRLGPLDGQPGWDGLTATVIVGAQADQEYIELDEGLTRPDGFGNRQFFWNRDNMTKIEPTHERGPVTWETYDALKSSYDQRIARLEEERDAQHRSSEALREELDTFKKGVVRVAMEYATRHDWCSTVQEALEEMGLNPRREVTLTVTGTITTEVPWATCSIGSSVDSLVLSLDSDYDGQEITLESISVVEEG